jgi:hypothetical protein
MGARDLLADLARVGLCVSADGDRLIVRPASKLTDDLRAALRQSKPELLAILASTQARRPNALSLEESDRAHAEPWNKAACDRFVERMSLFMRVGIDATDADDLAERLHLRDVDGDRRRMCIECRHHRPGAIEDCANAKLAGTRLHGRHAATLLQHCPGFESAEAEPAT